MTFDEKDLKRAVESARRTILEEMGFPLGSPGACDLAFMYQAKFPTATPAQFYESVLVYARTHVGDILE